MRALVRGYGIWLTALFFGAAAAWAFVLIILPQFAMLDRALTAPKRGLDSSVAEALELDARTCINVLETYAKPVAPVAPPSSGAMGIPSMSGMASPSLGGMAVPSMSSGGQGGAAANRPYILQCDRATTHKALVRPGAEPAWLDTLYGVPLLTVRDTDPVEDQLRIADEIAVVARDLNTRLKALEATQSQFTLANFSTMIKPTLIPMSAEQRAADDATLEKRLLRLVGLRFDRDGAVHERLGLIILARTITFAVLATALALVVCYPIAFKVALATPPDRAVWMFLGLVIPYAIVELMRIYAWTAIIDNNGLINALLLWMGAIAEPIQFKRSALTVFVVIVYTYVLFMVFPIFNVMSTLDRNQIEAAEDLGASTWRVHTRVVIPHAKPGIAVGCIATFMLAAGAFSVPRIISRGLQSEWFSQTIYNKFFESENSNIGAAYSFAYTLVCFGIVALFMVAMRTRLKDFARVQ